MLVNGADPAQVAADRMTLNVPHAIRDIPGWLVWKAVPKAGGKVDKVPYYCTTRKERKCTHGSQEDRENLVRFNEAMSVFQGGGYDGIGIAPLREFGIVAGDFDDKEGKGLHAEAQSIASTTYSEKSPSGKGIRSIWLGTMDSAKNNPIGVEVFGSTGFVTITGNVINDEDINPLPDHVRQQLAALTGSRQGVAANDDAPSSVVTAAQVRDLRSALNAINPDEYAVWIAMGHALKTLGDTGRELWLTWSQQSDKWQPKDGKRWSTFKPMHTGYEAVFAEAQRRGWVNPAAKAPSAEAKAPVPAATTIGAGTLIQSEFPPLKWCVEGLLPEGTYLLSAKPKVGKSWLALQIALAIAKGASVMGKVAPHGDVLVLALEDNHRRLKSRLLNMGAGIFTDAAALDKCLELATEWPRVDDGGADRIEEWLKAHPDAKLVVVDTLAKFRPTTAGRANAYEQDYRAMEPLKRLSDQYRVTILVVTHNRKMDSDDPLDLISGTLGLSGGSDGALVIDRQRGSNDATLHVIGRDIEDETALAIRFDRTTCNWRLLGNQEEITASRARDGLLSVFKEQGRPMMPKEVAELAGRNPGSVRRLLRAMAEAGNLECHEGAYRLPGTPIPEQGEHPEHPEHPEQGEQ